MVSQREQDLPDTHFSCQPLNGQIKARENVVISKIGDFAPCTTRYFILKIPLNKCNTCNKKFIYIKRVKRSRRCCGRCRTTRGSGSGSGRAATSSPSTVPSSYSETATNNTSSHSQTTTNNTSSHS